MLPGLDLYGTDLAQRLRTAGIEVVCPMRMLFDRREFGSFYHLLPTFIIGPTVCSHFLTFQLNSYLGRFYPERHSRQAVVTGVVSPLPQGIIMPSSSSQAVALV